LLGNQEIDAIMQAVRGLRVYDEYVFVPADAKSAPGPASADGARVHRVARQPTQD